MTKFRVVGTLGGRDYSFMFKGNNGRKAYLSDWFDTKEEAIDDLKRVFSIDESDDSEGGQVEWIVKNERYRTSEYTVRIESDDRDTEEDFQ